MLLAIIHLLLSAASPLPFIAVLVLIAGRRGNAPFCLWGAERLLNLATTLAIFAAFWFPASYLHEISHFGAPLEQKLAPLLQPQGMPWSTSFAVWLLGFILLACAAASLRGTAKSLSEESYRIKQLWVPIFFSLASTSCFYATYLLINWPFAGLPEGLTWDRASMAIFRNANRNFFLALCPAGGLTLIVLMTWSSKLSAQHLGIASRWLAFWATVGCAPNILTTWGTLMGLGFRGQGNTGFEPQTAGLIALTLALFCWVFIIWKPRYYKILAIPAFFLLLLKTILPIMMQPTA